MEDGEQRVEKLLKDQVIGLLKGHVASPNAQIAHAVKRATETNDEAQKIQQRLQEIEKERQQLIETGIKLTGARDSYRDDIREALVALAEDEQEGSPDKVVPVILEESRG